MCTDKCILVQREGFFSGSKKEARSNAVVGGKMSFVDNKPSLI